MSYDNDWNKEFDPQSGRLVQKSASSCTVQSIVRNVWNHVADEHNKWHNLSQHEQNELIDVAVANAGSHRQEEDND